MYGLIIFSCFIASMVIWAVKRNQKFDINAITDHRAKDVAVIKPSQYAQEGEKWLQSLKDQQFISYHGKLGNTARRRYVMYNLDQEKLFSITDVGNRDIIIIEMEGKEKIYQRIYLQKR